MFASDIRFLTSLVMCPLRDLVFCWRNKGITTIKQPNWVQEFAYINNQDIANWNSFSNDNFMFKNRHFQNVD